jgi:hypothetical protein
METGGETVRVIYKLLMFVLIFNISVLAIAAVTGTQPITGVSIPLSEAKNLKEAATSNVEAASGSNIAGFFYTIPVIGTFVNLLVNSIYIEGILSQPPFNLGFEVAPGITFAGLIQAVIWMVYAAAIIDAFMKTRMTQD